MIVIIESRKPWYCTNTSSITSTKLATLIVIFQSDNTGRSVTKLCIDFSNVELEMTVIIDHHTTSVWLFGKLNKCCNVWTKGWPVVFFSNIRISLFDTKMSYQKVSIVLTNKFCSKGLNGVIPYEYFFNFFAINYYTWGLILAVLQPYASNASLIRTFID